MNAITKELVASIRDLLQVGIFFKTNPVQTAAWNRAQAAIKKARQRKPRRRKAS